MIEAQIRLTAAEQGIPVGQARADDTTPSPPPPTTAIPTTEPPTTPSTALATLPPTTPRPQSPAYPHPAPPRPPPSVVDQDYEAKRAKLETQKALEEQSKALQVVERKQENKRGFDEVNIAPPGSIAEAILEVAGMGGAHVGRGFGTLTGLHLSERANADPATTAALTTGGGALGSVAGKRAAKKVTEHAIRGAHKVYEQGPAARKEGFQRPQIQEADRFMGWGSAWADGWSDLGEF